MCRLRSGESKHEYVNLIRLSVTKVSGIYGVLWSRTRSS